MSDSAEDFLIGCGFAVIGLLLTLPFAFLLQLAWNAVIPSVFGLIRLDYWQSVALLVVGHVLFPARAIRVKS